MNKWHGSNATLQQHQRSRSQIDFAVDGPRNAQTPGFNYMQGLKALSRKASLKSNIQRQLDHQKSYRSIVQQQRAERKVQDFQSRLRDDIVQATYQ